jgi:hypothetical protein
MTLASPRPFSLELAQVARPFGPVPPFGLAEAQLPFFLLRSKTKLPPPDRALPLYSTAGCPAMSHGIKHLKRCHLLFFSPHKMKSFLLSPLPNRPMIRWCSNTTGRPSPLPSTATFGFALKLTPSYIKASHVENLQPPPQVTTAGPNRAALMPTKAVVRIPSAPFSSGNPRGEQPYPEPAARCCSDELPARASYWSIVDQRTSPRAKSTGPYTRSTGFSCWKRI